MRILGIETSCDETSAAVVEDGVRVLSNVIFSQVPLHQATGGVVPEVAAREHVVKIVPVVEEALRTAMDRGRAVDEFNIGGGSVCTCRRKDEKIAGSSNRLKNCVHVNIQKSQKSILATCGIDTIDAIAVTQGPGLLSSLVIGTAAASTLATVFGKPLIGVNHIAGHIYANWLNPVGATPEVHNGAGGRARAGANVGAIQPWRSADHVKFPCMVLTASGGHNELVLMRGHDQFELLGETLDDAAGEAFDKVARLLGMGYPGGPQIARAAHAGNAARYSFPKSYLGEDSFDFSFSGLKTAMLNFIRREHEANNLLSEEFIADCAASFQEGVCAVLSDKLLHAAQKFHAKTIIISGGVSANLRLRAMIAEKIAGGYFYDHKGKKVALRLKPAFDFPADISFCTDNAAMIAGAAYFQVQSAGGLQKFARGTVSKIVLGDPNLRLSPLY